MSGDIGRLNLEVFGWRLKTRDNFADGRHGLIWVNVEPLSAHAISCEPLVADSFSISRPASRNLNLKVSLQFVRKADL